MIFDMSERHISDILENAPSNWGKWGDDDEIGALNYLTQEKVLRGIQAVENGEVHALGLPFGGDGQDLVLPKRSGPDHYMKLDKGDIDAGKADRSAFAGWEGANDALHLSTHSTTHVDTLGHAWYDDELYNGFDAATTNGGLARCGVDAIAENGIVGRGVLLDIARHRGEDYLASGERIELDDIEACAADNGIEFEAGDVVLLRTGAAELFYTEGPEAYYEEYTDPSVEGYGFNEPGVTYSEELVEWIDELNVPLLGTDTIGSEQTYSEETGSLLPLHPVLLRDLGVVISELNKLDDLASACADDGKYDFLYVASPLKITGGTGSPVNPLAIR
jgi:kynurenine formamidase